MGETRRKSDKDSSEGAVRLVRETGKPIVQVARDLGSMRALGNWLMLTGTAGMVVTGRRGRAARAMARSLG